MNYKQLFNLQANIAAAIAKRKIGEMAKSSGFDVERLLVPDEAAVARCAEQRLPQSIGIQRTRL